jgi:hypothetical protein
LRQGSEFNTTGEMAASGGETRPCLAGRLHRLDINKGKMGEDMKSQLVEMFI